ncbi:hypothetical protein BCR39DRAFT_574881 [Naematelia encephala]|uniref:Short-chain dehydrogenase/reductase 3 n=1 Tax=Naematelia encephala TaxID=71784 RepID=A0A1Y2B4A1_9TREE|nr:hypothetical protein BCR39DRAFT_574881 [Naematelia encephala]
MTEISAVPHPLPALPSSLDIDLIVKVLNKTFFSPFFCAFLPLTFLSQVKSTSHPAFILSCIWTALVFIFSEFFGYRNVLCITNSLIIDALNHLDRIYTNQGSFLFAPPKLDWEEQIVLITGGGTGVGRLLAETLALRNVTVVVLTKSPPLEEIENNNILTYICDVSDCKQVQDTAARVREEVGDPTILVNNAGVIKGKLLLDLTEEDITETFGANTLAHFWILKAFLPTMLRRGAGHVVNISSIMGLVGAAQMSDYCASKAALISLHETLRAELNTRYLTPAIRTTLVLPSHIQTSLFERIQLPPTRFWRFLAPTVSPHTIVKEIIQALDSQESRVIRLPFYSQAARVLGTGAGLVPHWLRDLLQWIANADLSMAAYGPKPDAGERLQAERATGRHEKVD